MDVEQVHRITNHTEAGWRVVAICVPTRAVRVITQDDKVFRVEQLAGNVPPKWLPLSSHKGDEVWAAFGTALTDAFEKQVRFKEKLKLAQHERKMADIKAREAAGL